MSRPDATAAAALDAQTIRPVFFAFLDFDGDPVRANTSGRTIELTGTGNVDLDGFTFDGVDPSVVDIGPVRMKEGGSETVRVKLSGLVGIDDAILAAIGDEANWMGRVAQLWRMIRDEHGTQAGAIQHYYTGYMTAASIAGDPKSQTIELSIESYLAALTDASNRTYLSQADFDPGDQSARAAIALANGVSGSQLLGNVPTPGVGGGGGGDNFSSPYELLK